MSNPGRWTAMYRAQSLIDSVSNKAPTSDALHNPGNTTEQLPSVTDATSVASTVTTLTASLSATQKASVRPASDRVERLKTLMHDDITMTLDERRELNFAIKEGQIYRMSDIQYNDFISYYENQVKLQNGTVGDIIRYIRDRDCVSCPQRNIEQVESVIGKVKFEGKENGAWRTLQGDIETIRSKLHDKELKRPIEIRYEVISGPNLIPVNFKSVLQLIKMANQGH